MSFITRREFLKNLIYTGAGVALGATGLMGGGDVFAQSRYRKGLWFKKLPDGGVRCTLCPLEEKLRPNQMGACRVRFARNGKIYTTTFGRPASMHLDPLEKNPVYHYKPGTKALALATAGCNLACPACQNWELSQRATSQVKTYDLPPKEAVYYAKKNGCGAITYTFTEPVVFYEYVLAVAKEGRRKNLSNHVVTGGYVNPAPLKTMCSFIDSFSVSIKGEEDYAYGGRPNVLRVIKNTLKIIKSQGKWLEIAVLVTPTINDSDSFIRKISHWIVSNLGEFVPVHFSRFYPSFKLMNIPQTPVATLERARKIAMSEGIKYVYIGNVPGHYYNNTFCHNCGKLLIQRVGFRVLENYVIGGRCKFCGTKIPGVW